MFPSTAPLARSLAALTCLASLAGFLALTTPATVLAQTARPGAPAKVTDANTKVPSSPPGSGTVDRSARCAPAAVNECRNQCDSRRYDTANKADLAKKQNECKVDCSRAC